MGNSIFMTDFVLKPCGLIRYFMPFKTTGITSI